MKIIIDKAIPFVKGVFEPHCTVEYIDGNKFTNNNIKDATALLIRTRTHCNKELLEGSSVKHIATATIGFDHIDMDYCRNNNIKVSTAAGCNARAVLQWFSAVIAYIAKADDWRPEDKTLGVVGVGNVGSQICKYAALWGFKVLCCDPPRQEKEGGDFVSFDEIAAKADIITFHTPLDATTHHLLDENALAKISPKCLILNSSRGEVLDTEALLNSGNPFVLDVWENEPNLNSEALQKARLATAHIAGYSLQGKANATTMAVRSIAESLSLPLASWQSDVETVTPRAIGWNELLETIDNAFDIESQSNFLKSHSDQFESIRNLYKYRNEYF